jgi:hypothetical protein
VNGRWVKGLPEGPPIPYRLPELLNAPAGSTVEITEGEHDAETLAALGLIATTNPGGAGKWTTGLSKWLGGFARANVYEDNDLAGRSHVKKVAAALNGVIPDIRHITFRELPTHGDVSDWLEGKTLEQLRERLTRVPKFAALESICAADVEMTAVDWVWEGRFALGKIGLIVGMPDEGKGLLTSDIIARVTRGCAWPCGEGVAPIGNVILLSAEDDPADTVVPRLKAAGADLKRTTIIKMMRVAGTERMFSLVTDLDELQRKIAEIGNVILIVIDPISAYLALGQVDSFRATDVRAVLGPVKELAEESKVLILGVMHFNKKTDVTNVILRISDSLAFSAASRHVYAVINDPEGNRKLLVKGKNNLAKYSQPTLAFSFDTKEVGTDAKTNKPIIAPHIVWHAEPVEVTATEAMQALVENKSPGARDHAKQFLRSLLESPMGSTEVYEAAQANGIAKRTLHRAQSDLKIKVEKDGPVVNGERTWRWRLTKPSTTSGGTQDDADIEF